MDLHHLILSLNGLVVNSFLSDADTSLLSSTATCLPDVSSLLFHSAVSNNLTSPLVPASLQIPTSQGMRFLSSNVDSLPNKLSELSFCMKSEGVDVAAITEVSPKNTLSVLTPDEIKIDDYQLFSNLNSPLCHQGVCLYIRDGLNVSLIQFNSLNTDGIESVWIKLHNQRTSIVVGVVYRSPSAPCVMDSESNLAAMLSHMMTNFASYDLVLMGDFNLPEIQWIDGSGFCNRDSPFLSALSDNSLCQTISQPTCYREGQVSNILDLVILSNPDLLIKNVITTPVGNSNHVVIISELCLPTKQPSSKQQKHVN